MPFVNPAFQNACLRYLRIPRRTNPPRVGIIHQSVLNILLKAMQISKRSDDVVVVTCLLKPLIPGSACLIVTSSKFEIMPCGSCACVSEEVQGHHHSCTHQESHYWIATNFLFAQMLCSVYRWQVTPPMTPAVCHIYCCPCFSLVLSSMLALTIRAVIGITTAF